MPSRLRSVDLVELRCLCLAAELGSLGRAAKAAGVSQPALSKRIRELEMFAGTELFVRSSHGVTLTAAGERLYRESRPLLAHAEAVEAVLDGLQAERATVRVAASHTIAEAILPAPLAAYRERRGHAVAIELVAANSVVVRDLVRERRFDLGLAAAFGEETAPGLREQELCADEVLVAVNDTHPWAGRGEIDLKEFLVTPMVMRDPDSNARRLLERTLGERGLTYATPVIEVGSTAATVAAAMAGAAPALLSRRAIASAGRLRAVRVAGLRLGRRFVVVTRAGEALPASAQDLAQFLMSVVS